MRLFVIYSTIGLQTGDLERQSFFNSQSLLNKGNEANKHGVMSPNDDIPRVNAPLLLLSNFRVQIEKCPNPTTQSQEHLINEVCDHITTRHKCLMLLSGGTESDIVRVILSITFRQFYFDFIYWQTSTASLQHSVTPSIAIFLQLVLQHFNILLCSCSSEEDLHQLALQQQ